MSHDKSHDGCKKTVHRLCSSYISSIENLTGTLSTQTWSGFKSPWLKSYTILNLHRCQLAE